MVPTGSLAPRQPSQSLIKPAVLHIVIYLGIHQFCGYLLADGVPDLLVTRAHLFREPEEVVFPADQCIELERTVPVRELKRN